MKMKEAEELQIFVYTTRSGKITSKVLASRLAGSQPLQEHGMLEENATRVTWGRCRGGNYLQQPRDSRSSVNASLFLHQAR